MNARYLYPIKESKRIDYLVLLLMGDESEEAVREYVFQGDMYSIHFEDGVAGVILFTPVNESTVELKNFALKPDFRGRGIGKAAIKEALALYKNQGKNNVIVGTANSSIDNIAFYQKAGFRMHEIKRDFFLDYPDPIIENGIRALDMIMFKKELS
ncbi:GNAT family N-acetyltransferase [Rossellomorea vietnamensis]|uniref:GNAT family N-acetyltransferase n=1 Tax=Rossellomorea vietnamensis TaxID=218284 RepID=A0A5D4MIN1_9BACI|nr:GNAT family N-acetyltransferase [Rossellomorea vietnamensis]TYS01437.1 GNAT family N-acetyltransferase [Rossellomorea vietnamensis]